MRGAMTALLLLATMTMHADVLDDLLRVPAPPPGQAATMQERPTSEPAADAPLQDLLQWWSNPQLTGREHPSAAVRERLIETIDAKPEFVESIVDHLPARPDVCERLQRIENERVVAWRLHHCADRRDALLAAARKAADDDGGYVTQGEELEALARNDWMRAEPILRHLAGSEQLRTRTLALSLMYEHEPSADLRATLQSIATNATAPGYSRDQAFEALARDAWEGRDEWLLAQMSDSSLLDLRDGIYSYTPFNDLASSNPDQWIPIYTRLLEHADPTVRSLAANGLAQFHLRDARADALRPLIPWISNPAFAGDMSMARLRLIQTVATVGLREAIPHLALAVKNDPDDSNRVYAAEALAEFGDSSANDAMRAALDAGLEHFDQTILIEAMIRTGAITAAELAAGVEAFLASGKELHDFLMAAPSKSVAIGAVVSYKIDDRDDLAALLLARAAELETTKPALARKLANLATSWDVPSANAWLLRRIDEGTADAPAIVNALSKRESLRSSAHDALQRLRAKKGIRAGIAVTLLGDAMEAQRILAGDDLEAQRALLATARLERDPLPVPAVAALFGRSPSLDAAAEGWLIADDGPAARAVVQKRHPNEIVILGSTLTWDPGHDTKGPFAKWETELLTRFRASHDDEWFALASDGYWSTLQSIVEVRIRGGKASMTFATDNGPRTASLSAEALGRLRLFLESNHIEDLGPLDTGAMDGIQYQYLHLTRTGGRRIFMNNPGLATSAHQELVTVLSELAENAVR